MPFLYKCEIFRKTFTRSIYFSLLPRSENSKRSEIQKNGKWLHALAKRDLSLCQN